MNGSLDKAAFEAFVGRVLTPTLRAGDVVVLDNLSAHKSERARELIEAAGGEVAFLPRYSPDYNPIELVFSKIKQLLRTLGCETQEKLWGSMRSVLDKITPSDAYNCFRHCGYTIQES